MNKKEIAEKFLQFASYGKVREAYEKYVHPDFRHHNPYFVRDRNSFLIAMEQSAAEFPNKQFEVLRTIEEGDLVVVHGRIKLSPEMQWIILIHIFRFEGDKII
ncbi:MAG: ester cyclase [Bacteroidetes bacterium]|nr:ester cyclase [Bacteroidota bacterium]